MLLLMEKSRKYYYYSIKNKAAGFHFSPPIFPISLIIVPETEQHCWITQKTLPLTHWETAPKSMTN